MSHHGERRAVLIGLVWVRYVTIHIALSVLMLALSSVACATDDAPLSATSTTKPPATASPEISRPATGDELLAREGLSGLGELTISNFTDRDAVVKLVDDERSQVRAALYIRSQSTAKISDIGPCTCILRFTQGTSWDAAAMKFLQDAVYSEFEDRLEFEESGGQYATYEATLHAVPDGNAPTDSIGEDVFAGQ
jgi:hypothetical protein